MSRNNSYPLILLTVTLPLVLAYFLVPNTVESHDIGRRTKFLVGLENTAQYAANWYCWYPSPDPNGGFHPETGSCGGDQSYTSLDWQVLAETHVILNVWSSDAWGADAWNHYNPNGGPYCSGVDVDVWDPTIWEKTGEIHYVHFWRHPDLPDDLGVIGAGDYDRYMGNVFPEEPDSRCPTSGPHLHQSGDRSMEHVWTGWNIPVTADPNNTGHWVHEIRW